MPRRNYEERRVDKHMLTDMRHVQSIIESLSKVDPAEGDNGSKIRDISESGIVDLLMEKGSRPTLMLESSLYEWRIRTALQLNSSDRVLDITFDTDSYKEFAKKVELQNMSTKCAQQLHSALQKGYDRKKLQILAIWFNKNLSAKRIREIMHEFGMRITTTEEFMAALWHLATIMPAHQSDVMKSDLIGGIEDNQQWDKRRILPMARIETAWSKMFVPTSITGFGLAGIDDVVIPEKFIIESGRANLARSTRFLLIKA